MKNYFLGVDVGTASVRIGLFDSNGKTIDTKTKSITIFNTKVDFYEQSSNEIWTAICECIKLIIKDNPDINPDEIVSIGFDATCSLVVLDSEFNPVTVSLNNDDNINVIMWMDHRSVEQSEFINRKNHECLKNVGGKISVEMDPPKILWLKENLYSQSYNRAGYFFSLPDYLVWKSTNIDIRSTCTTSCKWLFKSNPTTSEWDGSFWDEIGLKELTLDKYKKIGCCVENPFRYLDILKISDDMAALTGLSRNVKVGVSMIDAHAGGIGGVAVTLGFLEKQKILNEVSIDEILVLVSGTSSCIMATTKSPKYINSVWGPYYSAMIPNYWLNEAGQSACGKLFEYLVQTHPAYPLLKKKSDDENVSVYNILNDILNDLAITNKLSSNDLSTLTQNIHVYPDFHGNRSPLADNQMTGSICGLKFDSSLENLAILYLASIQSLAYQTKHIVNLMKSHGCNFKVMTIIGGLASNKMYCQLQSDITELPVVVSTEENDSIVLLGASILGASNFCELKDLSFNELIKKFGQSNSVNLLSPNNHLKMYHEKKFKIYLKMIEDQLYYRQIMNT